MCVGIMLSDTYFNLLWTEKYVLHKIFVTIIKAFPSRFSSMHLSLFHYLQLVFNREMIWITSDLSSDLSIEDE